MIKSPFSSRKPQDFRILMFYPNLHMSALMPQVIGIFTALFKREGYTIDLFDATYYKDFDGTKASNANEERVKNRNVAPYSNKDWEKKQGSPSKHGLKDLVKEFIGVGLLTKFK